MAKDYTSYMSREKLPVLQLDRKDLVSRARFFYNKCG